MVQPSPPSGYIFNGWTGSNGSTAQPYVAISKGSTGNKNYNAIYIRYIENIEEKNISAGFANLSNTWPLGSFSTNISYSDSYSFDYKTGKYTLINYETNTLEAYRKLENKYICISKLGNCTTMYYLEETLVVLNSGAAGVRIRVGKKYTSIIEEIGE